MRKKNNKGLRSLLVSAPCIEGDQEKMLESLNVGRVRERSCRRPHSPASLAVLQSDHLAKWPPCLHLLYLHGSCLHTSVRVSLFSWEHLCASLWSRLTSHHWSHPVGRRKKAEHLSGKKNIQIQIPTLPLVEVWPGWHRVGWRDASLRTSVSYP